MPDKIIDAENPFEVLGFNALGEFVSDEELRQHYTKLVKEYPPERNPDMFRRIRKAYETLRRPADRARYALFNAAPPPAGDASGLMGISPAHWLATDPWSELLRQDFSADYRTPNSPKTQKSLIDIPSNADSPQEDNT